MTIYFLDYSNTWASVCFIILRNHLRDLINEYNNKKLCSNLHLPIQSGSDFILSKMKRKHTALEYKNMIRKVRSVRPDISVTSDFIIGYPGETEDHFQETLVQYRIFLELCYQRYQGEERDRIYASLVLDHLC